MMILTGLYWIIGCVLYHMIDFLYSRYEVIKHIACKKKNWRSLSNKLLSYYISIFFFSSLFQVLSLINLFIFQEQDWKMVYYFQATGVSGEVDPPVTLYMGKHKEESKSISSYPVWCFDRIYRSLVPLNKI